MPNKYNCIIHNYMRSGMIIKISKITDNGILTKAKKKTNVVLNK